MLDDREFGILFLEGATNVTLLRSVETVSGPQIFFYPTGRGDTPSKLNVAGT